MRISAWLRFLIGNRAAIEELAADRRTLWCGLLFVLSAALAREYDGEDLLHEPWYLLLPLGASLVASFCLFAWAYRIARGSVPGPPFFRAYPAFLSLFWMTAPLAWLYAVPYERFLTPLAATQMNLLTLAVVSLWRVALMIRVMQVLLNYNLRAAIGLVMTYASVVVLAAVLLLPFPLIDVMGGIRYSESEALLCAVRGLACPVSLLATLVFGLFTLAYRGPNKPAWQLGSRVVCSATGGLLYLALASVAIWLFVLPFTQREQQIRYRVEELVRTGHVADALAMMSAHQREEFPPHWDPPPSKFGGMLVDETALLLDVCEAIANESTARWVVEKYADKLRRLLSRGYGVSMRDADRRRLVELLRAWPEAAAVLDEMSPEQRRRLAESLHLSEDLRSPR